jgi:hypothetical protein
MKHITVTCDICDAPIKGHVVRLSIQTNAKVVRKSYAEKWAWAAFPKSDGETADLCIKCGNRIYKLFNCEIV